VQTVESSQRASLVDRGIQLSVRRQCELLNISRSRVYYVKRGESFENLALMKVIDHLNMEDPCAGTRRMRGYLDQQGHGKLSRERIGRLMRLMAITAIYPRKRTTIPGGPSGIYPYRLKDLSIDRPNQVWCADITYIPMRRGFMYLFAIMDWYSRKVLSWELSNTLDTGFCIRGLEKAFASTRTHPEIFNTDQGCQFTSEEWTGALISRGITISMDGKGRWLDNGRKSGTISVLTSQKTAIRVYYCK